VANFNIKPGPVTTVTKEERQTPCQLASCDQVNPWDQPQPNDWILVEGIRLMNVMGSTSGQLWWCSWKHLSEWAAAQA